MNLGQLGSWDYIELAINYGSSENSLRNHSEFT